eukprot:15366299-Ditylum_brightwellii.AAC.2
MNTMGLLKGYGGLWLDSNGIANILSLSKVKHKLCVIYNSAKSDSFKLHKPSKIPLFHKYKNSLHYHNTANRSTKKEGEGQELENNVSLLNNIIKTVKGNKDKLLVQQVEAVSKARKLYAMVGSLSDCDF